MLYVEAHSCVLEVQTYNTDDLQTHMGFRLSIEGINDLQYYKDICTY